VLTTEEELVRHLNQWFTARRLGASQEHEQGIEMMQLRDRRGDFDPL
jgi:hypothetical protein